MLAIYYEDKNDNVVGCHSAPKMELGELREKIRVYNMDHPDKPQARLTEIIPGTLEWYLFHELQKKKEYDRERLQDLINALSQAQSIAESLE